MKTALIDAGGGWRGVYAAGVLDYCLEFGIDFDICIGISAGSANAASYIAGQKGRNYRFYTEYSYRPEYVSMDNLLSKHSLIDMDYIYSTLSNRDGENPLDYKALAKSDKELIVVATNALTGKPAYFDKSFIGQDQYDVFKASCSIPVVNEPYPIRNIPFFDGALSDPIPLKKALEMGAEKVVVLLTKPVDHPRKPYKDIALASFMKKYPAAAHNLRHRTEKYNEAVAEARQLEKEGKALIISPDDTCGVDTLTRDHDALHNLYLKGYLDGARIAAFLKGDPAPADPTRQEVHEAVQAMDALSPEKSV